MERIDCSLLVLNKPADENQVHRVNIWCS